MQQRFHALDAARAAALLLGVLLHAAVPFLPANPPAALARLSPDSIPFVFGFHYIHIFRLPAFFLMAGFLGRLLLHRRGFRGFIRNRLVRILVPLVLGWLVFYPMILAVAIWRSRLRAVGAPVASPAAHLWHAAVSSHTIGEILTARVPLAHLWFLYYLLLIYVLVLSLRWLGGKWGAAGRVADNVFKVVLESRYGAICFAAPLAVALFRMPAWGFEPPDHGLLPHWSVLFAYLMFFLIGWLLSRQPELLRAFERRAYQSMAGGVAMGVWPLVLLARTANPAHARLTVLEKLSGDAAYALAMVLMAFGFLGLFVRWMSEPRKAVRYVSDSAYWVYLAHYPLVLVLGAAAVLWRVHWAAGIPIIVMTSFVVTLITYQFLVRYSWIGAILHGPRSAPASRISTRAPESAQVGQARSQTAGG